MIKKLRGKIAVVLVMILLGMTALPNHVSAADTVSEESTESVGSENIENSDTEEENQVEQTGEPDEGVSDSEQVINEEQYLSDENEGNSTLTSSGLINYVGVDYPYLQAPDEQKLVVSFGNGNENISDAKLICQKPDGAELELGLSEKENELYLFRHSFKESDAGVYQLLRFSYVQDGVETTVNLREIGIEAMFGVDEYYPGYGEETADETEIDPDVIEMSVVNIDTDEVENAEKDVEEAIELTSEDIENDEKASEKAGDAVVNTAKSFLSSVADIIMPATTVKAAENVVVVLDPGHGGSDGGASANGLVEENLTLKIAQYCKEELETYNGVTVYMTRESDVYVGLGERVQKAKSWGADIFVSLHINSATASAHGVEVWYPNSNYNATVHNQGKELSNAILKELAALGLNNRGIKEKDSVNGTKYADGSVADYYSVIRDSKNNGFPGIIVEHAFISNASDAAKLAQDSFLKKLGIADATGIANYFNLSKGGNIRVNNINSFDGTAQIQVSGLGNNGKLKIWNGDNVKEICISTGQEILDFNINQYNNVRGTYYIEGYNASGQKICESSFYISKDPSCSITLDAIEPEKIFKAEATFVDMPTEVRNIQFATWSVEGGQDDLIWYGSKQSSAGNWTTTIDIRNHKTAGTYNIHIYATLADGTMRLLGIKTFDITKPTLSVKIENCEEDEGSFEVVVDNIVSPSGVESVYVPVWCAEDQSDIKWYEAEKQCDDTYKVTVRMANHNYATGEYKIHTYITTGNGMMVYGGKAPNQNMEMPQMTISAADTNGKETLYELKASNVSVLGLVRNVQFATWSVEDGQDDIIWYNGSRNSFGEWTATADIRKHKTSGVYNVHVYATLADGTLKMLGTTTFNVTKPTLSAEVRNYKKDEGTFDVVVDNVVSPSGVEFIHVPVWCAEDQSDIKWYEAEKQDGGTYKVTVRMANHNYAIGEYKIHVYITTGNGMMVRGGEAPNQKMEMPQMTISAADTNGKETLYELKASNVSVLGLVRNVQFATWSVEDGQDDIIWYNGSRNSFGEWTATADIRKHKTSGVYNVHVYATLADGTLKMLGTTTFNVTKPTLFAEVRNYKKDEGTFDVVVDNVVSPSGVEFIYVPVWCAEDQSDIKWYEAEKQGDGTYKVTVRMANHNYAIGEYKIHVYITTGNGMMVRGGGAPNQKMEMPQMTISAADTNGKETLYELKASNVSVLGLVRNVQFATWSVEGGQDDIIWYNGSRNSHGEWTATADVRKHKTSGAYNVHVYATLADGTLRILGTTTFEVSKPSIAGISTDHYDESTGSFNVIISGVTSPSGVANVQVPIWCSGDQSDIRWYEAKNDGEGNYIVNVDPIYHNYNSGLYKIHVYITTSNGVFTYTGNASQMVSATKYYTIMGATTVSIDQMKRFYESSGAEYPSLALGAGGAPTLEKFCQLYIEEASAEGVRAEVAFAQAMHETGWLRYGGIVQISQYNFAGIGALDGNTTGNCASFSDVRTGIRAQIQHLKAYGSKEALVNTQVDPRFHLVSRGVAPYVEWLGQKENPTGAGWATSPNYGYNIVNMIRKLKKI